MKQIAVFAVIFGLFLVGCACSDRTFELPSDEYPLEKMEKPVDPIDGIQATTLQNLTVDLINSHSLDIHGIDNPTISTAALNNFAISIMEVSNGDTYAAAGQLSGWERASIANFREAHNEFVIQSRDKTNYRFQSSLWMVWPIKLDYVMVRILGTSFGSDVILGGNPGFETQRAVDDWANRFSKEAFDGIGEDLSKDLVVVSLLGAWIEEPSQIQSTTVPFEDQGEVLAGLIENTTITEIKGWTSARFSIGSLEAVALLPPHQETSEQLTKADFPNLIHRKGEKSNSIKLPYFASKSRVDLSTVTHKLGSEILTEGPIEMRTLAKELDGPEYKLNGFWQYFALSFNEHGLSTEKPSEATGVDAKADMEFNRPYFLLVLDGENIISATYINKPLKAN